MPLYSFFSSCSDCADYALKKTNHGFEYANFKPCVKYFFLHLHKTI